MFQMREAVGAFLMDQLDDEPVIPAVLMLFTLNGEKRREMAVEVVKRYLENILENPDVEKYRRIREQNATFQVGICS